MSVIEDWKSAELCAAAYLRTIGFPDALVTGGGPDEGIDVHSFGALAQVKFYGREQIRRPDIQRLVGARQPGSRQSVFFFSTTGYSRQAVNYADSRDVLLFTYDRLARYSPVNVAARNFVVQNLATSQSPSPVSQAPASQDVLLAWSVRGRQDLWDSSGNTAAILGWTIMVAVVLGGLALWRAIVAGDPFWNYFWACLGVVVLAALIFDLNEKRDAPYAAARRLRVDCGLDLRAPEAIEAARPVVRQIVMSVPGASSSINHGRRQEAASRVRNAYPTLSATQADRIISEIMP